MAKVRVYELAKEFGVESKAVMAKLQEMGEFVRSASSTIEAPVVRRLKEAFASQQQTSKPQGDGAARSELIRVVAAGDEIVPDVAGRLPGRGAYLHSSLACLERAQRRRAFPRALRLPAALPDGKVAEYLTACGG